MAKCLKPHSSYVSGVEGGLKMKNKILKIIISGMYALIPLPEGFTASTTAVVGQLFSDWQTYIYLILGCVLAVFLIEGLTGGFRK